MFNYKELEVTGIFYIEFRDSVVSERKNIEDLIRYWYKSWFYTSTKPVINWINLNAFNVRDIVKVELNLCNCKSKKYIEKDFIDNVTKSQGDNRRSIRYLLTEGINNYKSNINKINSEFIIVNEYMDIPNPYTVKDFTVKPLSNKLITVNDLVDIVNNLSEQEDEKLNKLYDELDTNTKYVLMRQQLDKLEVLSNILELTTKL